ncbi:MAG: hypothetical protein JWN23_764 [Rhodocyclales bacterium]|nr:hypothetical protein [Rhodocyclales bacterium]
MRAAEHFKRVALGESRHMQRKLMGLLLVLASSAFAQTSEPLSEDDPAVWAARAERATSLKAEASRTRHAADAQRARDNAACRKKFLENACKDSARERWIEEINKVRAMEIEAVGLERNQRAHEIAVHEKAQASAPPRPQLILPHSSAPAAQPKPGAAPLKMDKGAPEAPKPQAKPLDKHKQAGHEMQLQQEQARNAQQAAERAEQAKKDAARYAAHAKEHAQKEAERKAKEAGSAPGQSVPVK